MRALGFAANGSQVSARSAFAIGWEAVFGPKRPVSMIRNPFSLRGGTVWASYEIPADFTKADLRLLVRNLGTMCSDWEPEEGFAEIEFRVPTERDADGAVLVTCAVCKRRVGIGANGMTTKPHECLGSPPDSGKGARQ